MKFELLSDITGIEIIAVGKGIRELARLYRDYGRGRWRKLKGTALVRRADGVVEYAEIRWYEAHGFGRKELKIKFPLED